MPARVKICGITNLEDALASLESGADALGFIFHRGSPRCITAESAAQIIRKLPLFCSKVGVFVDETVEGVIRTSRACGLDYFQLHGSESPRYIAELADGNTRVVKAFRVKGRSTLDEINSYRDCGVSAFLLDSYVPGQLGGTGATFNWDVAIEAKQFGMPIILAGGLTPENIADAVCKVQPDAVDVSSGVEAAPGKKDLKKVREFIAQAKAS